MALNTRTEGRRLPPEIFDLPVDAYGVGSSLIRGENDFTGDIVLTDGRATAKVGRRFRPNERLELVS